MVSMQDRPQLKKPGLIDMKYSAITFGTRFKERDSRYMERIAEMCNLSNGERTVAEIARIVRYEVGPIDDELVTDIFSALKEEGFLILADATSAREK